MGKKMFLIIIPIVIIIIGILCLIFDKISKSSYGILKEGKGFSTYEFDMAKMDPQRIEKVSDGYIMISNINNNIKGGITGEYDNDIRIVKYDETFKKLWSYDYIHDENDYIVSKKEKKENKYLISYNEKMIEKEGKLFFIISVYSPTTGYENNRLLILNKDGSLYDEHRFEEDITSIISVEDKVVTLYGLSELYMYNYETKKISKFDTSSFKESIFRILDKNDDGYVVASQILSYIDGSERVSKGTNSLYVLDKEFVEKKILSLDKLIGVRGIDTDYNDIRVINERIYISYFVRSNTNTRGYSGLLVLDKELNIVNNIKYTYEVIKEKFGEDVNCSISDYYVYNGELYILVEGTTDEEMLLSVYDENGKEIKSFKAKTLVPKEMSDDDGYGSYGYKIIYCDEKELIYYSVFSNDPVNSKKDIYKSILRFGKVEL